MTDVSKKPWYKEFWLWFIIALPLLSVIGGTTSVYLAYQNADEVIVKEQWAPLEK